MLEGLKIFDIIFKGLQTFDVKFVGLEIFDIIIPQKSFSYIKLLWINELFVTFPGKINY